MTLTELNDWALERGLPDEWRLSLGGAAAHPKVMTLADIRLALDVGAAVRVLHVSQENETPPPWHPVTSPSRPPPLLEEAAGQAADIPEEDTPRSRPRRRREAAPAPVLYGKIERKSEAVGVGCLVQAAGVVVFIGGGALCLVGPFAIIGTPMLVFAVGLLIYGGRHAVRPCCSLCKTAVDRRAIICPGCRCTLEK